MWELVKVLHSGYSDVLVCVCVCVCVFVCVCVQCPQTSWCSVCLCTHVVTVSPWSCIPAAHQNRPSDNARTGHLSLKRLMRAENAPCQLGSSCSFLAGRWLACILSNIIGEQTGA
ncbi:hypothetical protein IE81DRAFT_232590 [Ceraceosorus guamensis]|uniref:Uncharacterized protein n=1 Tax=Ceraceosorus guamensis TaxID=1522189 RepID=A0A316VRQ0_9BASI|nr:hypothetical protein IE81DRAFT_232590 [Ceraceosorus guamensis]PWN40329.1 hypothetical protein IE81DRAFT_232590 [Ceraceosorus guamensis]